MRQATKGMLYRFTANYMILIAIFVLCAYSAIANPVFLRMDNVLNVGLQSAAIGIAALGMTTIMIGGYIDLSLPGMFALTSVTFCKAAEWTGNPWIAILAALGMGLAAGAFNGAIMVLFGARTMNNMLFISYGMGMVFKSLTAFINDRVINLTPHPVFKAIGEERLLRVPISFLIFLAIVLLMHLFLKKTVSGKSIYYLGCNYEGARLAGINTRRTVLLIFIIGGLLAAAGSIVNVAQVSQASTNSGYNYEINAITAAVLGGTAFKGGRGGAFNTCLGAIMFVLLANSLQLLGFSAYAQYAMKGLILVAVILLDSKKDVLEARG